MKTPLLITIPFSHYCDKARWALDRAGVAFDEVGHLPLLHFLPVRRAGGRRTVPVLVTEDGVLDDSPDIVRWVDRRAPPERRLLGDGPAEEREITELERLFDTKLGPDTRRWAYFHILPRREVLLRLCDDPRVSRWERLAFPALYPVARALMTKAMNINAASAQRSVERIDAAFERVGALLADGRPFLAGARLNAADLTFATLAAPLVMPPEQRCPYPALEELPPEAADQIKGWRAHPAGEYALRLYREHRR